MDITLRVKPEALKTKSAEFTRIIDDIEKRFRNIMDISGKTRGYWIGEAGDKDRQGDSSYQTDISYIMKRLREHPVDLLQQAGIYEEAERKAASRNAALKTDTIV